MGILFMNDLVILYIKIGYVVLTWKIVFYKSIRLGSKSIHFQSKIGENVKLSTRKFDGGCKYKACFPCWNLSFIEQKKS
jgi:hypothetical protein